MQLGDFTSGPPTVILTYMNRDDRHFNEEFSRFMYNAYVRDGDNVHRNEALLLACLLNAKGTGSRKGKDLQDVQRIMNDRNLDKD